MSEEETMNLGSEKTFLKCGVQIRLVSNYLRKRYVDIAEGTTMPKAQAAFIMGDKTKIALEGIHLDLIYGRGLRFVEDLIRNYTSSGLAYALNIVERQPTNSTKPSIQDILAPIQQLD